MASGCEPRQDFSWLTSTSEFDLGGRQIHLSTLSHPFGISMALDLGCLHAAPFLLSGVEGFISPNIQSIQTHTWTWFFALRTSGETLRFRSMAHWTFQFSSHFQVQFCPANGLCGCACSLSCGCSCRSSPTIPPMRLPSAAFNKFSFHPFLCTHTEHPAPSKLKPINPNSLQRHAHHPPKQKLT